MRWLVSIVLFIGVALGALSAAPPARGSGDESLPPVLIPVAFADADFDDPDDVAALLQGRLDAVAGYWGRLLGADIGEASPAMAAVRRAFPELVPAVAPIVRLDRPRSAYGRDRGDRVDAGDGAGRWDGQAALWRDVTAALAARGDDPDPARPALLVVPGAPDARDQLTPSVTVTDPPAAVVAIGHGPAAWVRVTERLLGSPSGAADDVELEALVADADAEPTALSALERAAIASTAADGSPWRAPTIVRLGLDEACDGVVIVSRIAAAPARRPRAVLVPLTDDVDGEGLLIELLDRAGLDGGYRAPPRPERVAGRALYRVWLGLKRAPKPFDPIDHAVLLWRLPSLDAAGVARFRAAGRRPGLLVANDAHRVGTTRVFVRGLRPGRGHRVTEAEIVITRDGSR